MKHARIFRRLGVAIILALLLVTIPVGTALAARAITLSASTGKVGDIITVTGTGFYRSTDDLSRFVNIYFSSDPPPAVTNFYINQQITHYVILFTGTQVSQGDGINVETGTISRTVTIPTTIGTTSVAPGITYYIYVTGEYNIPTNPNTLVGAYASFSVTGGEISISPLQGKVDSLITITGSNFAPNTAISVKFDGTVVPIESGSTVTSTTGTLTSSIAVPDGTAGAKTVSVTVGIMEKTATFTVTPDILITPQSGGSGTTVLVSGTGFGRRVVPTIYFNNYPAETLAPVLTDTKGTFSASFLIPGEGLSAGVYQVEADDGTDTAAASFTLTVAPPPKPEPEPEPVPEPTPTKPVLTINSSGDTVGANIGIGGSGFTPKAMVTIKYDDKEIATATADADGLIMAIFGAPPSTHGDHIITVSDGTHSNTVTFTVESVAPPIPPPLLPEMGVKAKSPVMFDWDDVTDESMPVTYDLQVATDKSFSTASLVIDKTDILFSTYILSEAEELKLAGRQDACFWRIRAVDAASNASEWTGAGEFYIGGPSSFPNWALYTLCGIGAVLIFGIGYWLGRRTAFYY